MRKKAKKKTLYDHQIDKMIMVKVEIKDKQIPLQEYTVGLQARIDSQVIGISSKHTIEEKRKLRKDYIDQMTELDSVILCKTLFLCLEPGHYDSWEELGEDLPCDMLTMFNVSNALAVNMSKSMPELAKEVQEKGKKLIAEYRKAMMNVVKQA
ncbi:MAG: hypothetical protein KC483_10020 [Nitrosarchaeum sp.]|nr:hypothetical protein [Nitrosarchaeum sp.]